MNKNIQAALDDATEVFDLVITAGSYSVVDQKMFAESIVLEAANYILQFASCFEALGPKDYAAAIKDHFGVK